MAALCKSGHTMDTQHKAIRALLSSMAPARAEEAVRRVGLPPDEESAVLAVDVHGRSCLQVAEQLYVSVDTVKRLRRSAYQKLQDEIYTTR